MFTSVSCSILYPSHHTSFPCILSSLPLKVSHSSVTATIEHSSITQSCPVAAHVSGKWAPTVWEQTGAKSTKQSLFGRWGAADFPWKDKHQIKLSLIGLIWQVLTPSFLSQQRKGLSYERRNGFEAKKGGEKNEHGTIFHLDVLIAAFHFGKEHLMFVGDRRWADTARV